MAKVFNSAGEEVWHSDGYIQMYSAPIGLQPINTSFVPDDNGVASYLIAGPDIVFAWNGTNSAGQYVRTGMYHVQFSIRDSFGTETTLSQEAQVLRSVNRNHIDIYNSAGELVKHFDAPATPLTELRLNSDKLVPDATAGVNISWGSGSVNWNGVGDNGRRVKDGTYTVKITREEPGKAPVVMAQTLTVLNTPVTLLADVAYGPNPVGPKDPYVKIIVNSLPTGGRVSLSAYNLNGELVGQIQGGATLLWYPINGKSLAAGIYLLRLEAEDDLGNHDSRTLKIALVR